MAKPKVTSASLGVDLTIQHLQVQSINGVKQLLASVSTKIGDTTIHGDYYPKMTPDLQHVIDTLEGMVLVSLLDEHGKRVAKEAQLQLKGI